MYTLYVGENIEWAERLKNNSDGNLWVTDSPFKARSFIFEHLYNRKEPVFIFVEFSETATTIKRITQLRKSRNPNHYLILVGESISPTLQLSFISNGIDEIISPSLSREKLQHLLNFIPRIKKHQEKTEQLRVFHLPLWKRCFDITFSLVALICLSPLLLLTMLAIRIESAGPVVYVSQRVGSNYKIFGFYKFRSMYMDADKRLKEFKSLNQYQEVCLTPSYPSRSDSNAIFVGDDFRLTEEEYIARRKMLQSNNFVKLRNDPRITKIGYYLRKYSIDELPQLLNILKGDMSIVGNRPLPLYEAELLTSDEYIERFMAPAGLTGLWQVEKRGVEGILSPEERKQLDIHYARNFSFLMDMKIILRTFAAFIQKENV